MQEKFGTAIADFDMKNVGWCLGYMRDLRETTKTKFDEVTAHIMTYVEEYEFYSEEEIEIL